MLYKMTQHTETTYYRDDCIVLNELRPIVLRVLKDWTGKKIGIQLAADILEEIMDGRYEHIKKEEDANEFPEGEEAQMDRIVRSGD